MFVPPSSTPIVLLTRVAPLLLANFGTRYKRHGLTHLGSTGRQRIRSSRRTVVHVRERHGSATATTAIPRGRRTNADWCSREGTRALKSRTRERARGYKQGEERRHTMIPRGNTTTTTNDDMIAAWLNEVDPLRMRRTVVEGQREPVSHTTHKARTRNLDRHVRDSNSASDCVVLGWTKPAVGTITSHHILNSGRSASRRSSTGLEQEAYDQP
jgi:hypothetical protein